MEKYPWISFKIDLRKLPCDIWVKLGECVSKCEHIKRVPLPPTLQKELHTVYLAKGVHATTAIEGNTLNESEVRDIIEKKSHTPDSKKYLKQEVQNIIAACEGIVKKISADQFRNITVDFICNLNEQVLANVPPEEGVIPGRIRTHQVVVGNVYRPPAGADVRPLLEKFCQWITDSEFKNERMPVAFSILKAIAAHLYIAWIHPFGDGNGRTARLVEFAILFNSGIPSSAAHLLSNHYNITRDAPDGYYKQLDKAVKTGDATQFFSYAIEGFLDGLKEHLDIILEQVVRVTWKDYVYQIFEQVGVQEKASVRRQRNLLLELSRHNEPLNKREIEDLSAKFYKQKTTKTLTRDLNELEKKKLIVNQQGTYKANIEQILYFRPFSISDNSNA